MNPPECYKTAAKEASQKIISSAIQLRKDAYLSQAQVGEILGLKNHTSISLIEQGKSSPGLEKILQILSVYGYSLEVVRMPDAQAEEGAK